MQIHAWAMVAVLLIAGCGGSSNENGISAQCATPAGAHVMRGTVTAVHDGDTFTLQVGTERYTVRLDGIDAPELAQSFGSESRQALAAMLLQHTIKVSWSQRDRYDRILGTAFTDNCQNVNLQSVTRGMAWFYAVYQCELAPAERLALAVAEANARLTRMGLWSQAQPTAPWVFRNGTDPAVPVCSP